MRFKDFFIRTSIFLPMVVWSLLLGMMLFGLTANLLGLKSMFYCTYYCKICLSILVLGAIVVITCQANACWKRR